MKIKKPKSLLVIVYPLILTALILAFLFMPAYLDKLTMLTILSVAAFSLILFIFRKEPNSNLRGQFLKHSTLALIGIVIVHFQYPLDFLLGNLSLTNFCIWGRDDIIIKSLVISSLGLLSYLTGHIVYDQSNSKIKKVNNFKWESSTNTNLLLGMAIFLLLCFFFSVNPLYLKGYYGIEKMGLNASYFIKLFHVVIYAIIIQNSRNMILGNNIPKSFINYVKSQGFLFNSLILIYLSSVALSGDRGPIIYFSITYASGYFFVTKSKFKFKYALIFFTIGILFIFILGKTRTVDRSLDFISRIQKGYTSGNRFEDNSISPLTQELAASIKALHATVAYIPEKHDYLWGKFQLNQLTSIFPFSNALSLYFFNSEHYRYASSAHFVTWIFQGDKPYSGMGTTVIADFYFDFGIIGVIFGMFFWGFLMRCSEISMYSYKMPNLFLHSIVICFISDAIYIARSSVLIEFKTIVWVYLILLLNKYVNKSIGKRSRGMVYPSPISCGVSR